MDRGIKEQMTTTTEKKSSTPAQALCFSKLKTGQTILCVIKKVNDFDMVLALPDQLTAFTTCTQISPTLTKLFSDSLTDDADDDAESGNSENNKKEIKNDDVPSLKDYYKEGDYCIASISTIKTEGKKRIEVTLQPSLTNASLLKLGKPCVNVGTVLSGTFISKEDHGWIVDCAGVYADADGGASASSSIVAFCPNENIEREPMPGLTVPFVVTLSFSSVKKTDDSNNNNNNNKTPQHLTLSTLKTDFASRLSFSTGRAEDDRADQEELRVGMLLNVRVISSSNDDSQDSDDHGINSFVRVSMGGGHGGRVGKFGLPESFLLKRTKEDGLRSLLEGPLAVGKLVRARIIFSDAQTKTFLLTLSNAHLQWSPAAVANAVDRIGERCASATVYRVDRQMGISLCLQTGKEDGAEDFAYCHVSRLEDDSFVKADSSLEKGPFRVGTRHECRIIDRDTFSGCWIASLQKSLIKEEFLGWKDVKSGQLVRGEVKKVEEWGLLVSLNSRLQAVCPVFHLTETCEIGSKGGVSGMGRMLLSKYQVGQKYKFRVLDLQPGDGKCCLSRKPSLLEIKDEKTIIMKIEDAVIGQQYHGATIVSMKEWGILVKFFNNVRAIIPLSELSDDYIQGVDDLTLWVGQVLPAVKVIKCDPAKGELVCSLRKQEGPKRKNGPGANAAARKAKKTKTV